MQPLIGAVAGQGGGGSSAATFTMTQLSQANRVYQRASTSGGGQGKGSGSIAVTISGATAGTINARCRAADGSTILQAEWTAATITAGATAATISGVDARLGWFYLDLKGADGSWQNGTVLVGMGRIVGVAGQSLMSRFLGRVVSEDATTLAALGITPGDNGRVWASYVDGGGYTAAAWTKPSDVGQGLGFNSAGIAEFLNLQVGAFGVNCGVVGHGKGSTAISVWQSGQAEGVALASRISAAGGAFESFYWFQGHSDASFGTSSYGVYYSALTDFFAYVASLNSLPGFAKYLTAIPNINSANWGSQAARTAIRKAHENWASANGAAYLGFADLEMAADIVHENQRGARRIARHIHRAMLAELGSANDTGPRVTGIRKSGVNLVLDVDHGAGNSLVAVGDASPRFLVTQAGHPSATALGLDAVTPLALSADQILLKLATDPGDVPLDVWPMGAHPAEADGSARAVYDNDDPEGFGVGRQLHANPAPVRWDPNVTLDTAVSGLAAAYAPGKFGNGRSSGEMQTALPLLGLPHNGLTLEFWVKPTAIPGGTRVLVGQNLALWIGVSGANPVYQVGSASITTVSTFTMVVGTNYHFRFCFDPGGRGWRFYIDGTLVSTAGPSASPTYAITGTFNIGGFGSNGSNGQFHYTQGVIDEVAIFNRSLSSADFTPPSAPYVGDEPDLLHLWHCDGNGVDSAVSDPQWSSPDAPAGANRDFLVFGDSRADGPIAVTPPSAGVTGTYNVSGYVAYLPALYPHVRFRADADFGIGGQTTTQMNTVPRAGTATKGKDYAAANAAANVIIIAGTNDTPNVATQMAQVNGILSTLSGKTIFLLNEFPRGKNDAGSVANAHSNPTVFKSYSDWLETLDYRVPVTGLPNVVSVNIWDPRVDPASGTNYYNLQGLSHDGLHQNGEDGYLCALDLRDQIMPSYDDSVDYVNPHLPAAADPANPTAPEIEACASRNPFLIGTAGAFTGWSGTTTGSPPNGMWMAAGGNAAPLNCDITYDVDEDGYRMAIIHVHGNLGGGSFGSVEFYENIGATHLASRGIAPGDTVAVVAKLAIDGIQGALTFNSGNSGQVGSGYYVTAATSLGLRRGIYGAGRLTEADYTTLLTFRTLDVPTPAGSTWTAANNAGAPQVKIAVNFGNTPGAAVDFTIYVSRMSLVKVV